MGNKNNWKWDNPKKRSLPERLVNAWCKIGRRVVRFLYPDMTKEELELLDQPFYEEWLFIFYREERRRIGLAWRKFWKWFMKE